MVDLWKREPAVLRAARARAHRGDRPRALGHHAAARAAGLRPRQPAAAAVGAAAHRPLRRRLGRPVRRRDQAHGRDGPRLHRHARERRPPPHRVHLRLRPPVLERHVHRASTTWPSYTMWRSGADQAPIYDWHKRHLQTLQWVAERPTTRWVVKAPSHLSALPLALRDLPRRPGRDHPPRPAARHRVAVRPDGDAALHALGPRRPRRPGRVHDHGPRAADGPRHRRARRRRHPRRPDHRRRLPGPGRRPGGGDRAALRRLGASR